MDSIFSLSVPLVVSSFGLIFVAELPDKTAVASLVLATRYPLRQVIGGAWLAFLVQTLVAVAFGSVLQVLPSRPVRVAAGLGFLVFAVLAARRDPEDEEREEEQATETAGRATRAPWLACFLVVFAAEWGDLTQLATAALVAQTGQAVSVGLGAVAALWTVTVIAAVAGSHLGRWLRPVFLKWLSVALFAAVGGVVLLTALQATTN